MIFHRLADAAVVIGVGVGARKIQDSRERQNIGSSGDRVIGSSKFKSL
jgi:hypothetical protein